MSFKFLISTLCTLLCLFSFTANAAPDVFANAGNTVVGNPNGDVTVVEFFDYRCGYCRKMPAILAQLIKRNTHVRVVLRDYVLFGEESELAARAALAAARQGSNVAINHALLRSNVPLTQTSIMAIAKRLRLNTTRLAQDMNDTAITHQLESNASLADTLHINGTPAFVIGKTSGSVEKQPVTIVVGAMSLQQIQKAVAAAQ